MTIVSGVSVVSETSISVSTITVVTASITVVTAAITIVSRVSVVSTIVDSGISISLRFGISGPLAKVTGISVTGGIGVSVVSTIVSTVVQTISISTGVSIVSTIVDCGISISFRFSISRSLAKMTSIVDCGVSVGLRLCHNSGNSESSDKQEFHGCL